MRRVWYIDTMVHYPEGDHDSYVDNIFLSEEDAIGFLRALKEGVSEDTEFTIDAETVFSYSHQSSPGSEVVVAIREAFLHTGEDDDA